MSQLNFKEIRQRHLDFSEIAELPPPPPPLSPSANSYFNLVGMGDIREQGGYFNRL